MSKLKIQRDINRFILNFIISRVKRKENRIKIGFGNISLGFFVKCNFFVIDFS